MQTKPFLISITMLFFYIPLLNAARAELSYDEWQKTRRKSASTYASVPRLHLLSILERLGNGTYCKSLTSFEECIHLLERIMHTENLTDGSQLLNRIILLHQSVLHSDSKKPNLS